MLLIDDKLNQGTKLSTSLVPVLSCSTYICTKIQQLVGKSVASRKSLLQVCNSYFWVTKLLINKELILFQGTLPHDDIVDKKLPDFMLRKPSVLVPQQVLCPVMQCGTRHRTVYVEITLSIGKQARKCHRKKVGSGKL